MELRIGWPQALYLGLLILGIILEATRHGKPKTGNFNVWSSVVASLIAISILWWGGFFK